MRKVVGVAFLGPLSFLPAIPSQAVDNPVAMAVRRLHLTPQQLLSLRDFLGAFSHGVQVDASDGGLFILRSQGSMTYTGEFALRMLGGGLEADRITGPATLDLSRSVQVPLRLLPKARAQIVADLGGSQFLSPPAPPNAVAGDTGAPSSTPTGELLVPQLAGLKLLGGAGGATLVQSRAVFASDGSGVVASVRAGTGQGANSARFSLRYESPIRSDGTHAWRDAVSEFDGDVQLTLGQLETRFGCRADDCAPARSVPASTSFHMIRWQHQLVAAVPPFVLSQLVPSAPQSNPPSPPAAEAAPPPVATGPEPPGPAAEPPPEPPKDGHGT